MGSKTTQIRDDDLAALKGSLVDRASALGSYLEKLRADLGRSDEGFKHALDACAIYTRAFVKQLDSDWVQATSREERREILEAGLESFLDREDWIDQRFARSSQREVPRALKTIAQREFQKHQLDDQEPVLTVGPPDSFEAQLGSLDTFLFEDFYVPLDDKDEAMRSGRPDISIFCAPYIEGTRVLWYPIVLGHEIAHIRLERGYDAEAQKAIVAGWLRTPDTDFSTAVDEIVGQVEETSLARPYLNRQLVAWATEVICDLNAVRLFGPAGLSAIAEFLTIIESQSRRKVLDPRTHPPLSLRLEVLVRYLKKLHWDETVLPDFAKLWLAQTERPLEPEVTIESGYVAGFFASDEHLDELIELVDGWGDSYDVGSGIAAMEHVAEELLDGVPGATHVRGDPSERWQPVTVADVVNGTWMARQALDRREAGDHVDARGVLIDCELEPPEKRRRLDSLASKAIDTLELRRLWKGDRGIVAANECGQGQPFERRPTVAAIEPEPESGTVADAQLDLRPGAVLSRRVISKLLTADRSAEGERMVVTPLSRDSIQNAAIDLRLGPDFIVFRHSATTAFDPLDRDDQSPRTMQERVHMSWGERFILHPQELVLASTLEYVVLPHDVAAQVLTRSSYGRLGLLTATAVQVQPGSRGCITLELVNQGETPISLAPGVRVAQLMLWSVADACEVSYGKYWFPVGPQFSKVGRDEDAEQLYTLGTEASGPKDRAPTTVTASVEGPNGVLASYFYELATSLGAREVRKAEEPPTGVARLGAEAGGVIVAVALSIRVLAATVQRWLQGRNPGVILEVADGKVAVRVDEALPRGTVVIKDRPADGERIRQYDFTIPPDTPDDIARAVRSLMRFP